MWGDNLTQLTIESSWELASDLRRLCDGLPASLTCVRLKWDTFEDDTALEALCQLAVIASQLEEVSIGSLGIFAMRSTALPRVGLLAFVSALTNVRTLTVATSEIDGWDVTLASLTSLSHLDVNPFCDQSAVASQCKDLPALLPRLGKLAQLSLSSGVWIELSIADQDAIANAAQLKKVTLTIG